MAEPGLGLARWPELASDEVSRWWTRTGRAAAWGAWLETPLRVGVCRRWWGGWTEGRSPSRSPLAPWCHPGMLRPSCANPSTPSTCVCGSECYIYIYISQISENMPVPNIVKIGLKLILLSSTGRKKGYFVCMGCSEGCTCQCTSCNSTTRNSAPLVEGDARLARGEEAVLVHRVA